MTDDADELTDSLERATSLLREKPAVRAEWKDELLSRLDQPDLVVTRGNRRWSVRPLVAIAAGILCAVVGGAATLAIVSSRNAPSSSNPSVALTAAPVASGVSSQVRFELVAPSAGKVSVVGDFNGWNPTSLPLRRANDGRTWEVVVPLPPGRYSYAFMVDGRISRDPVAPQGAGDDFGIANSIVLVKGS